jgi:hypothetical protein
MNELGCNEQLILEVEEGLRSIYRDRQICNNHIDARVLDTEEWCRVQGRL